MIPYIPCVVLFILLAYREWTHTIEVKQMRQLNNDNADRFIEASMMWAKERKELLDRIQAGSFQEYKTQEIRMTRAQNKAEPERPYGELL